MTFFILAAGTFLFLVPFFWTSFRRRAAASPKSSQNGSLHFGDRLFIDRLQEAVVVTRPDWTVVDCNRAFTDLFGYTDQQLLGRDLRALCVAGADLPAPGARAALKTIHFRKRNGALFPGETSFSYLPDADRPDRIIALVRDNTERVEAESKVRQLNESLERRIADRTSQLQAMNVALQMEIADRKRVEGHLAADHAVTQILAKAESVAGIAPKILEVLCESLGWDLGIFWKTNDEVAVLTCIEIWRPPAAPPSAFEAISRESLFWPNEGLPGRVWSSGEPVWLTEVEEVADFVRKVHVVEAGFHSALAFPIRGRGGVSGVMEFFSHETKRPSAELSHLLVNIGSQIGQFLDRKGSERALRESETRKRAILESAPDCMITLDQEGRVLEFNPAAERTFGYTRGEILGLYMADRIIPPRLRERHRDAFARRLASGPGEVLNRRIETTGMRADGSEFPVELTIIRIPLEGPPIFQGFLRDITGRKEMEETLHRRERRFRALIEQSSDAIALITASGLISYASPSTSRLLGDSIDEFIGKNAFDLIHPDDQERTRALLAHLVAEPGRRATAEYRLRHRDGSWRWMEGIGTNLIDDPGVGAVVVNYRDITDRKRDEEALAREKERLAVTLGSIGDGVIATDVAGVILFINKVAQELSGWRGEEAIGRPLNDVFRIIHEKSRQACESPVQKALATGEVIALEPHTLLIARDGKEYAIADSGAPIRDREGKVIGVVLVFRDVTQQQRMEEELLKTSTLESLGLLAGGVAHDFNNILTAILGNLSLAMLSIDPASELHRHLAEAERASVRAKDLAQQLLTFAKGGTPVKKTASVVDLLKDSANFAVRGSNVRCEFQFGDRLWPVEIDEGQIAQVIHNLILNAQQAMPDGGIIRIGAENLVVGEEERALPLKKGPYLRISVRDFGIGIPRDHLPKIFDPYFTTKQKGSGLGLSTSYSIIRKHDGYIAVESELGQGSTFFIYLPAHPGAEAPETRAASENLPLQGEGRILVVDDEAGIRQVVAEMLRYLGYEAVVAADGAEAIESYRSALNAGRPFDLTIIDLTIPGGMGGKEAAKKLREIDPAARVVAVSGYTNDPVLADLKKHRFDGFIPKPFQLNDLARLLKTLVPKRDPSP